MPFVFRGTLDSFGWFFLLLGEGHGLPLVYCWQ
jgi:hypothetical protein